MATLDANRSDPQTVSERETAAAAAGGLNLKETERGKSGNRRENFRDDNNKRDRDVAACWLLPAGRPDFDFLLWQENAWLV